MKDINKEASEILRSKSVRRVDRIIKRLVNVAPQIDSILVVAKHNDETRFYHSMPHRQAVGELELAKAVILARLIEEDTDFGEED